MSPSLNNADLAALLPAFMRRQEDDTALAAALSAALQPLAAEIEKLSTWGVLEKLPEDELDALAAEIACLWYDPALPIETKRALLLDSDRVYQRLGTRAAVQDVVATVFGRATVQEFWEYDEGRPHHFRIQVADPAVMDAAHEAQIRRLLDVVKRKSQWLDALIAETRAAARLRIGVAHALHAQISLTAAAVEIRTVSTPAGSFARKPRWMQIPLHYLTANPPGLLVSIAFSPEYSSYYEPDEPIYLALWAGNGTNFHFVGFSQNAITPAPYVSSRWSFAALKIEETDTHIRLCPIRESVYNAGGPAARWDVTSHIPCMGDPATDAFVQLEGETREYYLPSITFSYV